MTEKELLNYVLEVEEYIHEGGECTYVSPHCVLELIDEIKRLRGLPVKKWPAEFLPVEPEPNVEFDFTEVLKRRSQ